MQEQPNPFLPEKEEFMDKFKLPQKEKLEPLDDKELKEYKRLSLTNSGEKSQENLNLLGAVINELDIMRQTDSEIEKILNEGIQKKEKKGIKFTFEMKINTMFQDFIKALNLEKNYLETTLMDAQVKNKALKEIKDLIKLMQKETVSPGIDAQGGRKFLQKIFKNEIIQKLSSILNKRYDHVYADQRRFEELSARRISNFPEKY